MRVAIVYNKPYLVPSEAYWLSSSAPGGRGLEWDFCDPSELGVVEQSRLIESFLQEGGMQTLLFAADDASQLAAFLDSERPDAVFNCCEAFSGSAAQEINVAALYELFGIPYTGSPPLALGIALNKGMAKALFQAAGVPTPAYAIYHPNQTCDGAQNFRFPVIVKPLCEDASIGIDEFAVVSNESAMAQRIAFVWQHFHQPALVEEFIDGRELNVAVVASSSGEFTTLPLSEIVFDGLPPDYPRIVSYDAKWLTDSVAYRGTVPNCPAELPPTIEERVRQVATQAARLIGLRDYGRIDMRLRSSDNAIFVLEANPNPDIGSDSGFVRAAKASGRTHASVVREILQCALARADRRLAVEGG